MLNRSTLNRLDTWNTNRIRRNYSPEVFIEYSFLLRNKLKEKGFDDNATEIFIDRFSPNKFLHLFLNYYSKDYVSLERLRQGKRIQDIDISRLSEGKKQEYIYPFLNHIHKLKKFIDIVENNNQISINRIKDLEIDNFFVQGFITLDNYIGFNQASAQYYKFFFQGTHPYVNKRLMEFVDKSMDIIVDTNPYIYSKLFFNLPWMKSHAEAA